MGRIKSHKKQTPSLSPPHPQGTCFRRFPPVLTVHLRRFDFDLTTFRRVKINTLLSFPKQVPKEKVKVGGGGRERDESINGKRIKTLSPLSLSVELVVDECAGGNERRGRGGAGGGGGGWRVRVDGGAGPF